MQNYPKVNEEFSYKCKIICIASGTHHVAKHLRRVSERTHFGAVHLLPMDGNLMDRKAKLLRNEEHFNVERPALNV